MMLGFEKGGEKDIQVRVVYGLSRGSGFERGQGDFLLVFVEGVSVHPTIMDDTSIKYPMSFHKDVTSIHENYITP